MDDKEFVIDFLQTCSTNDLAAVRIFIEGIKARYEVENDTNKTE